MSEMLFDKSVYTSRSSGYKYRTLATNTVGNSIDQVTQTMKFKNIGEKKRRDVEEDNIFDTRFQEIRELIHNKIDQQFEQSRKAREMLLNKFNMIDGKITTMLEFQNIVKELRKDLTNVSSALDSLNNRVEKLDVFSESTTDSYLYMTKIFGDSRDVMQQRGEFLLMTSGDYHNNNIVDDLYPLKKGI